MSAMILDEELDTSWLDSLDLGIECDMIIKKGVRCPNVAVWKIVLSCCGQMLFFCTECKDYTLSEYKRAGDSQHMPPSPGACGTSRGVKILSVDPI